MILKKISFILLLVICGIQPWKVFAQASPGYVKLNTAPITALTYTDAPVTNGAQYQYQIVAVCTGTLCGNDSTGKPITGASVPLTGNLVLIPATGVHSVTTAWLASTTPNVTYDIYRIQAAAPNPPGAVSSGIISFVN